MRAQLGSESKCKEELAQSIARVNEQYAAAKTEWRAAILEAEEGKRREARELEERFRRELEVPRAEKARLEERVAELQAKMTGLAKDAQLARRREEVARTEAEQLRSARAALEEAKATLQRKVEELREQNAHAAKGATVEAAIRSTTDATIRRLENEIQFLKSQLAVEASCKDELQGALRSAQPVHTEKCARKQHFFVYCV